MKRETERSRDHPAVPKYVPVDQSAVNSFQRNVEEGDHAAFEYVESTSRSDGWFERGVIEEIVEQNARQRITLRTITQRDSTTGETHYTIYLQSDGDVEDPIPVYKRDTRQDTQPTLSDEYPEPSARFTPDELPGCEQVGILVGAGVMTEYRFHEPKPTEKFWIVPDSTRAYSEFDETNEFSVGVVNRTGEEQTVQLTIDFPDWVAWKHDGLNTGNGVFTLEKEVENDRQVRATVQVRSMTDSDGDQTSVDVPVTLELGPYSERFTVVIHDCGY